MTDVNMDVDATPAAASGELTRLSASPASSSTSSLTSSSSFDPHAHPEEREDRSGGGGGGQGKAPAGPSVLGLRELARMRKDEKRARRPVITATTTTTTEGVNDSANSAGQQQRREIKLLSSVFGSGSELPFAVDAQILGWKVVGGKNWTDLGRIGAYVVYEIEVTLRSGGKISILRRYTDFVNLRTALKTRYPAFREAIPPLPGKAHISRFSQKFLEDRQPRLQRFLRGVLLHPEMGKGGERSIVGGWVVNADTEATHSTGTGT